MSNHILSPCSCIFCFDLVFHRFDFQCKVALLSVWCDGCGPCPVSEPCVFRGRHSVRFCGCAIRMCCARSVRRGIRFMSLRFQLFSIGEEDIQDGLYLGG